MNEQEIAVVPVEEQISQELVKHNVTDAIISSLREKYLPLKINGIEDKETYLKVKEARKECKALRVLAKKICVAGRDEANKIQKAWVEKEKDITSRIGEVEDYLDEQETWYDEAVEAEKARRKREQEEQLIMRQQVLSSMNVLYADGMFTLGEVSFEMSLIKECDPEIWDNDIKPKFEEAYRIDQAERLEQERIKAEKEAELKRQQEELEQQKLELQRQQEELRKAQEEQERKQREEEYRKRAEENARIERLWRSRLDQLEEVGWNGQEAFSVYDNELIVATYQQLITWTDDEFSQIASAHNGNVATKKEEENKKRQAEIEAQKEAERKRILGETRLKSLKDLGYVPQGVDKFSLADLTEEEYDTMYTESKRTYEAAKRVQWEKEQEEKRQREEAERLAKLEAAKDKEKWDEMVKQVNAIELYDMRSSQYRTKAQKFRQKLDELKAICNG